MVSAPPPPTLTTSEGDTISLSPRIYKMLLYLLAVESIIYISQYGQVILDYSGTDISVTPCPVIRKLDAATIPHSTEKKAA